MTKPRWDEGQLATIIDDLKQAHKERDIRAALWRALIYRDTSHNPAATGTFIPKPFDKSQLVLKFMIGDLMDDARQLAAQLVENTPIVEANRVTAYGKDLPKRVDEQAADLERFLMGVFHACDGRRVQSRLAWSQVTQAVGWLLCHEKAAGWGLPERLFYMNELPEGESPAKFRQVEGDQGRTVYRERAELWERRKADARRKKAEMGDDLVVMHAFPGDSVYADYDERGVKVAAIIQDVPAYAFGPGSEYLKGTEYERYGLIKQNDGTIIGGESEGQPVEDSVTTGSHQFTLHRILSRDEIYYYVTGQGGSKGGKTVYFTPHDYGEVPLDPVSFMETDSTRPEHRYVSALEAAYAYAPLINQAATMLSNLAALKGTPRQFIETKGVSPIDEPTGELKKREENIIGTDPEIVHVLEADGKLRSLNELLQDDGTLFNYLQLLFERMDKMRPPDVSKGQGGESTAWGTRLNQEAFSRGLRPAVNSWARALERANRRIIRTIRNRQETVGILSIPGRKGDERGRQYYIEVEPDDVTDNITVIQDARTRQEKIVDMQIGGELLAAGRITERQYQEEYVGEQDPDAIIFETDVERILQPVKATIEQFIVRNIMGLLPGALANLSPNLSQTLAEQIVAPAPQIAAPAGIVEPGVGMAPTQPELAPLQGGEMQGAGMGQSGAM